MCHPFWVAKSDRKESLCHSYFFDNFSDTGNHFVFIVRVCEAVFLKPLLYNRLPFTTSVGRLHIQTLNW